VRVGLCGEGDALGRRAALLVGAGLKPELLPPDLNDGQGLQGLRLLFVAGLDVARSHTIAGRARAQGVLVNVEDEPELCDFHVPAIVRRGELLLTVSTGGQSPGLARRLREWLETKFTDEWQERLARLGADRETWRASGVAPSEISRRTDERVAREEWLH